VLSEGVRGTRDVSNAPAGSGKGRAYACQTRWVRPALDIIPLGIILMPKLNALEFVGPRQDRLLRLRPEGWFRTM